MTITLCRTYIDLVHIDFLTSSLDSMVIEPPATVMVTPPLPTLIPNRTIEHSVQSPVAPALSPPTQIVAQNSPEIEPKTVNSIKTVHML